MFDSLESPQNSQLKSETKLTQNDFSIDEKK